MVFEPTTLNAVGYIHHRLVVAYLHQHALAQLFSIDDLDSYLLASHAMDTQLHQT